MKKFKAFTIIEIIVVVSILSSLIAISAVSYLNQVSRARDQKRLANLELIKNQMELYKNQNRGVYPGTLDNYLTQGFSLPQDPKTNTITGVYTYKPYPVDCPTITAKKNCVSYQMFSQLENNKFHVISAAKSETISVTPTGF